MSQFLYWLATNDTDYKGMLSLYRIPDINKTYKHSQKASLKPITTNLCLYVPMIAKVFDMEESHSYDNLTDESLATLIKNPEILNLSDENSSYSLTLDKHKFDSSKQVKMRLLCPFEVRVDREKDCVETNQIVETAIVHFHGGGMVCGTSSGMQSYTRRWANELNIPVFSVDYRVAPENPYPDPVNDCYQAYVWVATQAKK